MQDTARQLCQLKCTLARALLDPSRDCLVGCSNLRIRMLHVRRSAPHGITGVTRDHIFPTSGRRHRRPPKGCNLLRNDFVPGVPQRRPSPPNVSATTRHSSTHEQMSSSAPRAGVRGVARRAQQQRRRALPAVPDRLTRHRSRPRRAGTRAHAHARLVSHGNSRGAAAEKTHTKPMRAEQYLYGLRRRMTACVGRRGGNLRRATLQLDPTR